MLIVGLGNPGEKYASTRHNVGFMAVDYIVEKLGFSYREDFKGLYADGFVGSEKIRFLKPMTFMNLSGESVRPCADYFDEELESILVIHDDMDIEYGRLKFRKGGSSGGHNGIKSIITHLGNQDFVRLKIGIGKAGGRKETVGHVLGKFDEDEKKHLDELVKLAHEAVLCYINDGLRTAMNRFNNTLIFKEGVQCQD